MLSSTDMNNFQIAPPPPQNYRRTNNNGTINNDIFSSLNEVFMQKKPDVVSKIQTDKSEDLFDDEFDPRADEKKIKEIKSIFKGFFTKFF